MAGTVLRRPFQYCFFSATIILIVINVAVFFLTSMVPQLRVYLGLNPQLFLYGHFYWQPLSYLFVHANLMHLLSNMIGLLFFGITLERAVGSKEFLLLYFVCGVLSGILSLLFYIFSRNYGAVLIGASGALYAVLFAYAVVFPRAHIYIWGILPVPSPLLVAIYAGIELFSQFYRGGSNISHFTHLFGFAVAFLYFVVRMGINPVKVWKDAYRR
ncbi:MAG: rhomboid family intramembrane serine protease [Treponemataceae bacterium]|nr:rhomboid family intramembrane serine protease [Treponemataceae bacterium]